MVALEEKSRREAIRTHYLGTMNVCTKFHPNPSYSFCQTDIGIPIAMQLAWLKNDLHGALRLFVEDGYLGGSSTTVSL